MGRAFAELGWEVISLDVDPGAEPTICADVCSWEPMPMFAPGYFDMIWASPPCTEYSRALTRRPYRLEEGDRTAIRTLKLIRDLRPRFWCIENPQTGLLKRRPFMANLQWSDVTYCKYGYPYKKATRLWHNLPWEPEHGPCCVRSRRPMVGGIRLRRSGALSAVGARWCRTAAAWASFTASPGRCAGRSLRPSTLAWSLAL